MIGIGLAVDVAVVCPTESAGRRPEVSAPIATTELSFSAVQSGGMA